MAESPSGGDGGKKDPKAPPSPAYLRALRATAEKEGRDALTEEEKAALDSADVSKKIFPEAARIPAQETDWQRIDFEKQDPYELIAQATGARETQGPLTLSEADVARLRSIAAEINDMWEKQGITMRIEYASAHVGGNEGVFEFKIVNDPSSGSLLVNGPIGDLKNTLLHMFLESKD